MILKPKMMTLMWGFDIQIHFIYFGGRAALFYVKKVNLKYEYNNNIFQTEVFDSTTLWPYLYNLLTRKIIEQYKIIYLNSTLGI